MIPTLLYIRRSEEASDKTVSLDDQEAHCRTYAVAHGLTVVDVLIHNGISGGDRDRIVAIRQAIWDHNATAMVVYHTDRLARDHILPDWIAELAKDGVTVHAVNRGVVEVATSSGYLLTGIEGLLGSHYRKVIAEKTKSAMDRLKAEGRLRSRYVPYGYVLVRGHLQAAPEELATIARMRDLREVGTSYGMICKTLNRDHVPTRTGTSWGKEAVRGILARSQAVAP